GGHNYGRIIRVNVKDPNELKTSGRGPIRAGEHLTVRLTFINSSLNTYAIKFKVVDEHTAPVPEALKQLFVVAAPTETEAAPVAGTMPPQMTPELMTRYREVEDAYKALQEAQSPVQCVLAQRDVWKRMQDPFSDPDLTNVTIRRATVKVLIQYFTSVSACMKP